MRSFTRMLAVPVLAAAMGLTHAAQAQTTPFRFGLALPTSGGQALYGGDQVQAAEWAVADINAAGGINGKKLEMIVLDTQADPQIGISAVTRLATVDKVPVFITGFSSVVKAVAPIANEAKVVELSVAATAADISKLGDYVYTTSPLADVDIGAIARYQVETLGKKRAAVIYINNETGITAAQSYRDAFTKAGGTIVAFEAYDQKATDWTGPLLKLRAANPDVIQLQGLVPDSPLVIAQMRQLGLRQLVASNTTIYHPKLLEQLGAGAEGIIATSMAPSAEDSPAVKAYVERWKREKGREPNGLPYTQFIHDAVYITAAVFRSLAAKNMPITGENFRQEMIALRKFDLPLTGMLEIKSDHTVSKPVILMEVRNNRWEKKAIVD
ncbi:ABC transporter substrate-binding protein [Bosea sp. (in: a-proteobacteria)]|uniref:ABC transporter substrate-binding protein n=1 Tax=Bosea sp. (in: a-proteobacteria) TaxID=1871050 RepID=UPI00262EAB3D|nr:ABC transporter substrate-binding protein [Bosea sp. (in: a-proteobacteria)]MCO5090600.1 ABC transporter substrate-binding protein [Bosea sp. (in: a-proteobacteria)]